jgi:hypothetical protein
MESPIDERYRLDLMQYYLEGVEERNGKIKFFCPFCQSVRKQGKFTAKKGAMFWIPQWNAWRFNCLRCLDSTSMYKYLMQLNPEMARKYQLDRYHSGTTCKGHDCPSPQGAELLIKSSGGKIGMSTVA